MSLARPPAEAHSCLVWGLLLTLCLCGCAALKTPEPVEADAAPPAPAASAPGIEQSYRVEIDAPENLQKLLMTHLDLARFQSAPQAEGITDSELTRLANASPAQGRALLETEGYFNAEIAVERINSSDALPLIRLRVAPGPRTLVVDAQLQVEGALQQRADAGDDIARALIGRLRRSWPLQSGEPFSQSAWSAAKNRTLAELRADGYPSASWSGTAARIDASTHTATLALSLDSGPLFLLGDLHIEGLSHFPESAVRNLADFGPGTPYSEKRLLDFQERVSRLGMFSSVAVDIDPDPQHASAVPVRVTVQEQKLQYASAGAGLSTDFGKYVILEHRHLRPFGLNLQAHNTFKIGSQQFAFDSELLSDPVANMYRYLLAANRSRITTSSDVTRWWRVRGGRSVETEHIDRLVFAEFIRATVENGLGSFTSRALTANYNWVGRYVDNQVLPTRGITSTIQVGAGPAYSNEAKDGVIARLYTRNTVYLPLGNAFYSQARFEFGEVFSRTDVGVPDPLLFRAGGDESVRGYGYHELGPTRNGVLVSGRMLLTGSVELAHPFSASTPNWWWATFFDAGKAVDQWADYQPAFGYGVGVRWRGPVGPVRIDGAYGRDLHAWRLHVSVGVTF